MPPPADGSGPATVRGRSEPRLGMHRGGAKASIPPRYAFPDPGGERVNSAQKHAYRPRVRGLQAEVSLFCSGTYYFCIEASPRYEHY